MFKLVRLNLVGLRSLVVKSCDGVKSIRPDAAIATAGFPPRQACDLQRRSFCCLRASTARSDLLATGSDVDCCGCSPPRRWYAKRGKDGKKPKKQQHQQIKLDLNDPKVQEIVDLEKMESQMESTIDYLRKELAEQLTLRVTLDAVAAVVVKTSNGQSKLGEIAQLQQTSPQQIVVNLAQYPQYASKAKTAIMSSGINITPQIDGCRLYLPIQKVTTEHREKLIRSAKPICEKYKERLKNIQNSTQRELKNRKGKYSEDLIRQIQEYITFLTKTFCDLADDVLAAKQKELSNN